MAVPTALTSDRRQVFVKRPIIQVAALSAVGALVAHHVPFAFAQGAVQVTQALLRAEMNHAGGRRRAANRADVQVFGAFLFGVVGNLLD